jgi:diguanylate cyclase (GGDEF)-like protein/PAS domain S-box-containing protein
VTPLQRAASGATLILSIDTAWLVAGPQPDAWYSIVQILMCASLAGWLIWRAALAQSLALEAQARIADVVADAAVGISLTALNGRLTEVNQRFAEIVGRTIQETQRLRFQDITHPDDLAADLAQIENLLSGRITRYRLEKRYLRTDSSTIWVMLTVSLARDVKGQPRHFISVVQDISALKQAEDDLLRQRRQLQQIIHSIPDCVAVRDLDGRYLLVNPAAERLIGQPEAAICGRTLEEIYPSQEASRARQADRLALSQNGLVRREGCYTTADSGVATIDIAILPLVGIDGRATGIISVGRDVSRERHNLRLLEQAHQRNHDLLAEAERSRLVLLSLLEDQQLGQQALAASEQRLSAVVAALPDLIFLFDARGVMIDLWASCEDKLLMPREQSLGRAITELLPPKLAATAQHHIDTVMSDGQAQVFEYTLAINDVDHWFEMRMASAGAHEVLAIARDITAERAARAALHRSEASLRLAVEGSGDGLWDWDLIIDKVRLGAAFDRLLRYEGDDLDRDFLFRERLHPDDRDRSIAAVRAAIEYGTPFVATYRLLCFDGPYRWFQGRGMCHRDAQGVPQRFSGVLTDLTERLESEERLRLAAQVLDSTQEGVMITDAQRRIVSVNRAFTTLLGYTEAEVLGQSPRMLSSGRQDRAFYEALHAQLLATGHWQGEIWNRRKDGEPLPELLSISAVRDPVGTVTHYVGVFTDISHLKDSEARLEFLAHHDPLTHLPNRLLFNTRLDQALHQAQREDRRLAVLLLDLDRFKDINDSYGHLAGDELLQHVAQRLTQRLRQSDTLARLGGDEFALLMHDLRYDDDAARLAGELLGALSEPWRSSEGVEVSVGVSIGICIYPDHGQTAQTLLQGADAALYRAKGDGRGVYRYYADEMTQIARERLHLEARLRRALTEGQFRLHYQPQVGLCNGQIIGAEALLRWLDPEQGLIMPERFIPVAEATGLISEIGTWVLGEACRQARAWLDAGLPALTMAVNVSPRQFHQTDLALQVMQILIETGLPPTHLELELTEGALMEREAEALQVLQRLRGIGVGVAIDDFGTGYSSLASLKRFPIDVLKIDRSFIADIPHDPDDMEIAAAIIAMGHSLGLRVLAEGVETIDQLAFLRLKHCDSYQGFLRSRAVPAEAFEQLLREQIHLTV